jgi:hypothetical protein
MKNILLLAFLLTAIFTSCEKPIDCDNATLCVKNVGSDTIYYCWGCNSYNDTLPPGRAACKNVGEIYVSSSREQTQEVPFETSNANYYFTVDKCYVEKEID